MPKMEECPGRESCEAVRQGASRESREEVRVMELTPQERRLFDEYHRLCHAMQSGVNIEQHYSDQTSPKHLRVGVNASMVEHSALCELLVDKGIITPTELFTSMIRKMEAEVEHYKIRIAERMGVDIEKITLA
jgi:hypothetical protein